MAENQQDKEVIKDVEKLTEKISSLPESLQTVVVMHASAFISGLEAAANLAVIAQR